MWRFVCVKCGEQRKGLDDVPMQITAWVELSSKGIMLSDWEGDLPTETLTPDSFVCPVCGGRMEIRDVPCTLHEWGETFTGYGKLEGKVMRQCAKCYKRQIGTLPSPIVQDPVWE